MLKYMERKTRGDGMTDGRTVRAPLLVVLAAVFGVSGWAHATKPSPVGSKRALGGVSGGGSEMRGGAEGRQKGVPLLKQQLIRLGAPKGTVLQFELAGAAVEEHLTDNRLPANVRAVLSKPSRVELLSLEPGRSRRKPGRTFHGWKVLGATTVVDPEEQRSLLSSVDRGIAESDGSVAVCFDPRHGVAVTSEATVVDLVICFECLQVQVFIDGKQVDSALTARSPQRVLDTLLEEARVPLGSRSAR